MVVSEEVSGEVVVEESEEVSSEVVVEESEESEEVSCEELVRLAREGSVEYTRYN